MKLQILSDLHIEFADFELPETDADVIVLAGDIGVGMDGLEWIKKQRPGKHFIYVPGNHEFYSHDISLVGELIESAPRNVHVLNNGQVVIDGVRFLGAVLWTDFRLFGEVDKWFSTQRARQSMNDFFVIQYDGRRFTPADSVGLHEISHQWLTGELEQTERIMRERVIPSSIDTDVLIIGAGPTGLAAARR